MSDTVVKKTMKADATAITKDDADKAMQCEVPKHPGTCEVPKNEHIPKNLVSITFSAIKAVVNIENKLIMIPSFLIYL